MNADEVEFLQGGSYLSFSTLKKSGDLVATPVWFAPGAATEEAGTYYLFSAKNAGKVKRLRNYSRSRVAACTVRGTLTGAWLDAESELLASDADNKIALDALHRKYGWQMKLTDLMSKISGKFDQRSYIRVRLKS